MIFKSKLYFSIILLIIIVIIGVAGFMIVSNGFFVDVLDMTIITMATVGYGTLQELDQIERIFTIFLVTISIVFYAYSEIDLCRRTGCSIHGF
ncbi:MAG: ion channel, partial [Lutibacter sp.]|nr:ion channel [Lutibacter sp.]